MTQQNSAGLGFAQAGDFLPYLAFNAKAGKMFFTKDKVMTEVVNPTFVIGFDKIKTAWMHFAAGQAPSFVYHPSLAEKAPRPALLDKEGKPAYKEGFKVLVFSQNLFGGVAEFSSSSQIVRDAVNVLYLAYDAGKAANPGLLPVVQMTGTTPIKGKHGTNFAPTWSIVKWVPAPAEFDAPTSNANTPTAAVAPVAAAVSEF